MTAPGHECEPRSYARPGTPAAQWRRATGSGRDAGQWRFEAHIPCPTHGCPGPARVPVRSPADLPAVYDDGTHHDTVRCEGCGAGTGRTDGRMSADVDPHTGDGFDAPPPSQAYANAPCLRREMHEVLALGAERDGRQARGVTGPPVDSAAAERARLLRRAALMDRMALEAPGTGAVGAAIRTAEELVLYDRRHPELMAGPHRPDSIAFDLGRRPYVRQEYAAWSAAGLPGV